MDSNTKTNRYGSIAAEIYDLDKPIGALPDTRFHVERLSRVRGRILEPACGTGRTLIPLLEAGCAVAGFEPSAEMLERCKIRCAERGFSPDLSMQRFEDFEYPERFAAIVVPVGSFTLIDRFETAIAVLRRFFDHLEQDGIVILDIQPLFRLGSQQADRRQWVAENGDLLTLEGVRVETDWIGQRAENRYRYERWRANGLIETQLDIMAQRYWGLEEFTLALMSVGFEDVRVTGEYDRSRPVLGTDRTLTFEATRR